MMLIETGKNIFTFKIFFSLVNYIFYHVNYINFDFLSNLNNKYSNIIN